jgi:hypothetical protein
MCMNCMIGKGHREDGKVTLEEMAGGLASMMKVLEEDGTNDMLKEMGLVEEDTDESFRFTEKGARVATLLLGRMVEMTGSVLAEVGKQPMMAVEAERMEAAWSHASIPVAAAFLSAFMTLGLLKEQGEKANAEYKRKQEEADQEEAAAWTELD